jgi:hypothetical protein
MFEWKVRKAEVMEVLRTGEVIAEYPEDKPFASRLLVGFAGPGPIHVVVAPDPATRVCHVVTVYRPDPDRWEAGFRARR